MRKAYERISEALRPWADREPSGKYYWEGKTEGQALGLADNVHRTVRDNPNGYNDDDLYKMVRSELDLRSNTDQKEIKQFIKHAEQARNKRNNGTYDRDHSKHRAFGVPHTAGKEELWQTLLNESGYPTEMLATKVGDPHVTDLDTMINGVRKLIDVQNIHARSMSEPEMLIGAVKNIGTNRRYMQDKGLPIKEYNAADPNDNLMSIITRIKNKAGQHGDGKLLATGNSRYNNQPDMTMRDKLDNYGVDYLVGGLYDANKVSNRTGIGGSTHKPHGNYDPSLPEQSAMFNLNDAREQLLYTPKRELEARRIQIVPREDKLSLRVPVSVMREISGVNASDVLAKDVLDAIYKQRKI